MRTTLEEFIKATRQDESANDFFQLENDRMLEINLDGEVWTKAGSMVAYVGGIKFTRERILERGLGNVLKKALSGEGAEADQGQRPWTLVSGGQRKNDSDPSTAKRGDFCQRETTFWHSRSECSGT